MRRCNGDGFTVQLPTAWHNATSYTLVGPQDEEFCPNVVIKTEPVVGWTDARTFAGLQLQTMKTTLSNFRLVAENPASLGMTLGHEVQFAWTDAHNRWLFQRQFFCAANGIAYIITCTCLASQRLRMEASVNAILSSFQFLP
jgi:hypothetical protein